MQRASSSSTHKNTCTLAQISADLTGAEGGKENLALLDIKLGYSSQGFVPHLASNHELHDFHDPMFGATSQVHDSVVIYAYGGERHLKFWQRWRRVAAAAAQLRQQVARIGDSEMSPASMVTSSTLASQSHSQAASPPL